MKKLSLVLLVLVAVSNAMAFEVTGTAKEVRSSTLASCGSIPEFPSSVVAQAEIAAAKLALTECHGLSAERTSDFTSTTSCSYSGPFRSIVTFSAAAHATFSCAEEVSTTCHADEVLVCIPTPPCPNGSIGCREAPRPAETCFCGRPQ